MSLQRWGTFVAFVLISFTSYSQEISSNKFGSGLKVVAEDSSFYIKASFRFQTLYEGTLADDSWSDKLLVRRSRLKFDGFAFSPKIEYKLELGLSNRDHSNPIPETSNSSRIILDAVLKWKFAKNWSLWFGQTKLPGNRERVISSQNLQFVDRSLVNSRFTLDRDIGVQLRHKGSIGNMLINKMASISMGEGRNITSSNKGGYDYTLRVELLPFGAFSKKGDYFGSDLFREPEPKLSVAFTYDYLDGAARQRGQQGSFMVDQNDNAVLTDLSTIFFDMMFKYQGFQMMAEYANKKNLDGIVALVAPGETKGFYSGQGVVVQAGYLMKNNLEFAARYTKITPDDILTSGLSEETEYTFGISKYVVGHALKVQSDMGLIQIPGSSDKFRFRLQTEIAF